MTQTFLRYMDKCVPDVFRTMVGIEGTPGNGDHDAPRPSVLNGITGSVSLTGKVNGTVYATYSPATAMSIAERILGMSGLSDTDVSDVIGELSNMITGNLKSQMADIGYNCQLSIPTVMRGDSIAVVVIDAPLSIRNTYFFPELADSITVQAFVRIESN